MHLLAVTTRVHSEFINVCKHEFCKNMLRNLAQSLQIPMVYVELM